MNAVEKVAERTIHDEDTIMERDVREEDLCQRELNECVDCMEC